jgi:hypothetical protein
MTCPRCHHPLAYDGITVEAGGVPITQTWVAGCLRCKWTPDDQRHTPPFYDPHTYTPRMNEE